MVTHMVLFKVRKAAAPQDVKKTFEAIGALKTKIPGILSYSWGPYASPEGLNKGFTHGFCTTFKDAGSRDVYLTHPEHEKVKLECLKIIDGGLDGVIAFDYGT